MFLGSFAPIYNFLSILCLLSVLCPFDPDGIICKQPTRGTAEKVERENSPATNMIWIHGH